MPWKIHCGKPTEKKRCIIYQIIFLHRKSIEDTGAEIYHG